jgi:hypothetical protein
VDLQPEVQHDPPGAGDWQPVVRSVARRYDEDGAAARRLLPERLEADVCAASVQ